MFGQNFNPCHAVRRFMARLLWRTEKLPFDARGKKSRRQREEGGQRKVILVIDRYAPEPDRDAGSRSTAGIVECLVRAGWVVKFWCFERDDKDHPYSPHYTESMEQMGVEMLDHRWPGNLIAWLRENGAHLDRVLINRPNIAKSVLSVVRTHTQAIVSFYGHDLHFARLRRQALYAETPRHAAKFLARATASEKIERRVWDKVDVVLYPSATETQLVQEITPWTTARTITPFYFPIAPQRITPPAERTILFVAGFAHFPNVDAARFLIHDIMPALEDMMGPVNVILAGSNPAQAVQALAGPRVEVTGYIAEDRLRDLYQQVRVAVVPLRIGAGVKGKVVEALSYGVPLMTTPVGVQGMAGLEAIIPVHEAPEDIARALAKLLQDDDAWVVQARAQRDFAQDHFSFDAMQKSVLDAFKPVGANKI